MDDDAALLPAPAGPATFDDADLADLKRAVVALEHTSLAARLSAVLGHQIDLAAQLVPAPS